MNSIFTEPYPIVHPTVYPSTPSTDYTVTTPRSYSEVATDLYPTYQTTTAHVTATPTIEPQFSNYSQPYSSYYPHYQQTQVHALPGTLSSPSCSIIEIESHAKDQGSPPLRDGKDGPTYDWMKIRRNPPKTTRKCNHNF